MKSISDRYKNISAFSGKPSECKHHTVFGNGKRNKADKDGLYIYLTNSEHNMSDHPEDRIHGNPRAEDLSKMFGEAQYIIGFISKKYEAVTGISADDVVDEAIEQFRKSYGVSYL